jgi:hypothetical protein
MTPTRFIRPKPDEPPSPYRGRDSDLTPLLLRGFFPPKNVHSSAKDIDQ